MVKKPIWFNAIRNKIQKNQYKDVNQAHADFVSFARSLPTVGRLRPSLTSSSLLFNSNSSSPTLE